jgi:hypothetical protein
VPDTQHGWNEIHPAWWVSAGTIQPPLSRSYGLSGSCSKASREPPTRMTAEQRIGSVSLYSAESSR